MTREEFKRRMKKTAHLGTSRTRPKSSAEESADIERLTDEFLAGGGKVERLPSEQLRPARSPAFNGGDL